MALAIATIADSISDLSVAGVKIYDIDEIPTGLDGRYPAIIPLAEYVTDFTMVRDSFGGGSTAKMTVTYTLHYRLCYAPVGLGRTNTLTNFAGMVEKAYLFLDAVLAVDTMDGLIDITPQPVTSFGVVQDPAEVPFWGCDFALQVMEFVN
jgi:hypothetical protein